MFLTLLGSISSDAPVYGEAHVGSRDIDPLRVHDSSGAPANGEALTVTKTVHDSSGAPANGRALTVTNTFHDSSGASANGGALTVANVYDSSGAPANGGGQSASSVDAGSFGVQIVVFVE